MKRALPVLLLTLYGQALSDENRRSGAADVAGVKGGLAIHLSCGDGTRTAALHGDGFAVHGLDTDVTAARKHVQSLGLYGKVSVAPWKGERLPYADNLASLVVADDPGRLPMDEVMRVLAPNGVALIGGRKTVKPWPKEIDEWPQHYHGADNNAVARDRVAGPPRRFQWINDPVYSRSHLGLPSITSMVSAKGRLFSIEDHGSVENPALPGQFCLVCRDAFNGIELWRRPFPDWHPTNIFIKLTPSQLQRRLVAVDGRVYCTPGLNAPITAFDAPTGKILRTYDGTERTQEFVYDGGVLFAVIGDPVDTSSVGGGAFTLGDSAFPPEAYGPRIEHREDPESSLLAMEAASGRALWRKQGDAMRSYQGTSLAVRGPQVAYATLDFVACLDRRSGAERWRTELKKPPPEDAYRGSGRGKADDRKAGRSRYTHPHARRNTVKLVLSDEAVYLAAENALTAFALRDGAGLWTAKTHMNHHKTPDVLLTGGAVWTANRTAYDPLTGEQIRKLDQKVTGPMGHDRCYENRITERWYINTASGGSDFLALDGSGEFPSPWGRSTCGIGHLPCNGLLYLGPPACSCGNKVQLISLNALSAEPGLKSSGQPLGIAVDPQLEKGPAYDDADIPAAGAADTDWPTYRHDSSRGGCTRAAVGDAIKPLWQTKLSTRASPPVIVAGRVYVADVDAHAVRALSADDGTVRWSYTAGGRVDTPPTWHEGRLLFGSRDGWVYCLRARDGALAWRFKALPDRLICAYEQVESAWPVCGSVLVRDGIAYFAAGRNSYVDGGLFLFGVDPRTGRMIHQRNLYGPYDPNGHPVVSRITALGGTGAGGVEGNRGDVLSARGEHLFLRHQAFRKDLSAPGPEERILPHLIPTHGFTQGIPHHRSFWTIDTELYYDLWTAKLGVRGDILVMDGARYYEIRGYPPGRYTTYDVRKNDYSLFAGELSHEAPRKENVRDHKELWQTKIPLTGKAMALAGDVLFVAGTPAVFPEGDLARAYEGRMGGVLWAASAADGTKRMEYRLEAPPVWDSLAATPGRLFLCTTDGRVVCFSAGREGVK